MENQFRNNINPRQVENRKGEENQDITQVLHQAG